jgi:hypothetical protein
MDKSHYMGEKERLASFFAGLTAQFREYVSVLEKQQEAILRGDGESALLYCAQEERILDRISDLQKAILPLEATYPSGQERNQLAVLVKLAELQRERNRELLKNSMKETGETLEALKNPFRNSRSIYHAADILGTIDLDA